MVLGTPRWSELEKHHVVSGNALERYREAIITLPGLEHGVWLF